MKYVAALIFAILLAIILLPVGFVMSLFYPERSKFLFKTCLGIDQLGNVVCARLFNATLIKSTGYQFGNEDEVISSVIGKNDEAGTLSFAGRALNWLLNTIQKEHTKRAIEYPANTDQNATAA